VTIDDTGGRTGALRVCSVPLANIEAARPVVFGDQGAAARALRLCLDHPAACMHCQYICARVLALVSNAAIVRNILATWDVYDVPSLCFVFQCLTMVTHHCF
jgi:hypothetical protein